MFLHAESLRATVALSILALAAGCSSATGPDVPGSGYHEDPGATGSSSGGSSSTGSSSGGGTSSGSSGGSSSGGSGGGSSSGASGSTSSGGGGTTISTDTTWADGQMIASSVTIAAGVTVTIAPGAKVTVAAGSTISVAGTLTGTSTATHAQLTGTGWTALSVASGGTLSLTAVDITGAGTALQTLAGAVDAEYDQGTITGAATPFDLAKGTKLGTKNATVTGTLGTSRVAGSLVASYLDYDSNGNEGITTTDPTATESFEDCTLHGSGPVADMVVSATGAASIHIAYTNITNVHCGFHFDTIDAFDVSYSNVETNAYGFMLYGSTGTGTRSVTYSNIDQNQIAFDTTPGDNGPITFDHDYITGTQNPADSVAVTNASTSAVTGTGPRAQ
ncbi:MAG TPA: hypothetical protein VGL81_25170 [Polyangiaceae bacterium]|jgi:hypothetical protein